MASSLRPLHTLARHAQRQITYHRPSLLPSTTFQRRTLSHNSRPQAPQGRPSTSQRASDGTIDPDAALREALRATDEEGLGTFERDFQDARRDFTPPPDVAELEPDIPPTRGFFADDDYDNLDDEPWDWDDISSSGHGELEQVREVREFYRVAGWDMPMLYQHAKPFQPPTEKTPLRFRYTTYLGETHPGSAKVVMDFQPAQLPDLTQPQRNKLIKLLGTRYNPHTATAKMSSERYPTAPQNKSRVVETLERLLKEVREGEDLFEDVPFDFRHAPAKKARPSFPEEWKMTEDKELMLKIRRRQRLEDERAREARGMIADGKKAMGLGPEAYAEEPELVTALRKAR